LHCIVAPLVKRGAMSGAAVFCKTLSAQRAKKSLTQINAGKKSEA
jgi:hypothetical protein